MIKLIKNTWEYLFSPWEITVLEEGEELWTRRYRSYGIQTDQYSFNRYFVKYKYVHKFRKEEKIVKEYLN